MTPVNAGDRLSISAVDWNRTQRAVEAVETLRGPNRDLGRPSDGDILIRNQWTYPLEVGDAVGIDGPIYYQQPTNEFGFNRLREINQVIWAADKPVFPAHQMRIARVLEPLAPQAIGRARVSGVAPVYVDQDADEITSNLYELRFVVPQLCRDSDNDAKRAAVNTHFRSWNYAAGRNVASEFAPSTAANTGHAALVLWAHANDWPEWQTVEDDACTGTFTASCVNDRWTITESDCSGPCSPWRLIETATATYPYPCAGLPDVTADCPSTLATGRRLVHVNVGVETQAPDVSPQTVAYDHPELASDNDDWCGLRRCVYHCVEVSSGVFEHQLTANLCRNPDLGVLASYLTCDCPAIEDLPPDRICDSISKGAEFRLQCIAAPWVPTTLPPTTQPPTTQPPTTTPPTTTPPTTTVAPCSGICGGSYRSTLDNSDTGSAFGLSVNDECNPAIPTCTCVNSAADEARRDAILASMTVVNGEYQCDSTNFGDCLSYCSGNRLMYLHCYTPCGGTPPTTVAPTTAPPTTAPPTTSPPTTVAPTTAPPTTVPPTTAPPTTAPPTTSPPTSGACCIPNIEGGFSCVVTTDTDCANNYVGATFQGAGTTCTPSPCG